MTLLPKMTAVALASMGLALMANMALADRGPKDGAAMRGGPAMAIDFAAMDADKDGKVTPAEVDAFRTASIAAADTDGDGFLSAEEMQAIQAARKADRARMGAQKAIERLDADKDGKLSLAEMEPRSDAERMIARLDTDKDGALSEAELAAAKDGKRGGKRDGRGDRGGQRGNKGQGNN